MRTHNPPFINAVYWVALLLWVLAICVLSSLQGKTIEPAFQFIPGDKFAHFVAFAVGGGLLAGALRRSFKQTPARCFLLAVVGIALFGAIDEWHQMFTPGRSGADVWDWMADLFGAMAGAGLYLFLHETFWRTRTD